MAHSPENFDPAKSKATLTEAFEASQDALDQMGRACALQHHAPGTESKYREGYEAVMA